MNTAPIRLSVPRLAGLLAATLWLWGAACQADVYKWVDKNGVAHYADQPPPPPQMDVQTLKDTRGSTGAAPGAVAPAAPGAEGASPAPHGATAPGAAAPAAAAAVSVPAAPAKPQSYTDKELEFRKRRLEAGEARDKQAKADAAAAKKAENCKQQRAHTASLRDGGRLVRYDDKGERVDVTDAEREAELRSAEQQLEAACK